MKLLFTTILLFAPKVLLALSENEGGLRGAVIEPVPDLDRELLTMGSTSKSLAFSVAHASSGSCFDCYSKCLEIGKTYAATSALADVTGNALAVAYSEVCLWLEATCAAYAEAQALACAFTQVDGDINVDTTNTNGYKEVCMSVKVKTATKTIALATSEAVALSYAAVGARSYTSVAAYCSDINNKSVHCPGGVAASELQAVGVGVAGAVGAAGALALSGSVTKSSLQVSAKGSSLDYINGMISAYAKSWSFALSAALAEAFAAAYVKMSTVSFAAACAKSHKKICGNADNQGKGICQSDPTTACALAVASGGGLAAALSLACAEAYAAAEAEAAVSVRVSANVSCKSVPTLAWTCTGADAETQCSA